MPAIPVYTNPNPPTSVQPTPALTIHNGDAICIVGDSITEDPILGHWFATTFQSLLTAKSPGTTIVGAGSGIFGGTTDDIIANWSTLYTAFLPFNKAIIELGINDVRHGFTVAHTQANVATIGGLIAASGVTKWAWIGPWLGDLGQGENWALYAANPFQLAIDATNLGICSTILSLGQTFVDWRDYGKEWEPPNNPTQAVDGIATVDGVHPVNPLGRDILGNWAFQRLLCLP